MDKLHANDLARGAKYAPENVADGNYETYCATDDAVTSAVIEVTLPKPQKVDGQWQPVFTGKKIGYKRIILEGRANAAGKQFPVTDAVRLKIEGARACPLISTFQIMGGV